MTHVTFASAAAKRLSIAFAQRGKARVRLVAQITELGAHIDERGRLISDAPFKVGQSFLYARHLAPIPPGRHGPILHRRLWSTRYAVLKRSGS